MSFLPEVMDPGDERLLQEPSDTQLYDVVIVGAGPYGLSIAAHLRKRGLKFAIFGKPMNLWRDHMPESMYLRSRWWGTNISDPHKRYSFARFFETSTQYKPVYPLPIETFIEYGLWFQKHLVPDVDETYVSLIERKQGQFLLTLADGRRLSSRAVVMAVGLQYYGNRPAEYDEMPAELVSHSFDHSDFSRFDGKEVAVIGAGQSAVEFAAILNEKGAKTHLVSRHPILWLGSDSMEALRQGDPLDMRPLFKKLVEPAAALAPGWKNLLLEIFPYLYYHFPQERKDRFMAIRYPPAASSWLRDRIVDKVELHEGCAVKSAQAVGGRVELLLSGGEVLCVDHVMLATGYRVNINRLPMLAPALLAEIQTDRDVPVLNACFESTISGLYFVGNTTVQSFGPIYRHIVGTNAAARRVSAVLARRLARARTK